MGQALRISGSRVGNDDFVYRELRCTLCITQRPAWSAVGRTIPYGARAYERSHSRNGRGRIRHICRRIAFCDERWNCRAACTSGFAHCRVCRRVSFVGVDVWRHRTSQFRTTRDPALFEAEKINTACAARRVFESFQNVKLTLASHPRLKSRRLYCDQPDRTLRAGTPVLRQLVPRRPRCRPCSRRFPTTL